MIVDYYDVRKALETLGLVAPCRGLSHLFAVLKLHGVNQHLHFREIKN